MPRSHNPHVSPSQLFYKARAEQRLRFKIYTSQDVRRQPLFVEPAMCLPDLRRTPLKRGIPTLSVDYTRE